MGSCCVREKEKNEHEDTIHKIQFQKHESINDSRLIQELMSRHLNRKDDDEFETFNTCNKLSPCKQAEDKQYQEVQSANPQEEISLTASPNEQNDIQEMNSFQNISEIKILIDTTEELIFNNSNQNEESIRKEIDLCQQRDEANKEENSVDADPAKNEAQELQEDNQQAFQDELTSQLRASLMNNKQFMERIKQYSKSPANPHLLVDDDEKDSFNIFNNETSSRTSSMVNSIRLIDEPENIPKIQLKGFSGIISPNSELIINFGPYKTGSSENSLSQIRDPKESKQDQLIQEQRKQETHKIDQQLVSLQKKNIMKQFNQGIISGTPYFRGTLGTFNVMNPFANTQGLNSLTSSTRSPNSSDYNTLMSRKSTGFSVKSNSVRNNKQSIHNFELPSTIFVPQSAFESVRENDHK